MNEGLVVREGLNKQGRSAWTGKGGGSKAAETIDRWIGR